MTNSDARTGLWCAALAALFVAFPVWAAESSGWVTSHAIAMHGEPKYKEDFTQFDYVNGQAPKGGVMRLNIVGTFDSLNPYIVKGRPAEGLTYVYETLMARAQNEPFTLYPLLAEKIDVREDRTAIRFHINPKARWQDGVEVTADDVLFSWATLRDKGRPNHRSYYKKVAKAVKDDALTVTFTFLPNEDGKVDREMPLIMGLMPVLPKHAFANQPFEQTSLAPPIASGPYKITVVDPGKSTTFTRDENYWGRDLPSRAGEYNFATIRYDYYRDENVAQEAFTAHQLDARRETDPKRWAELQRMEQQKKGEFRTFAFKHQRPEPFRAFIFNTRRPLFQNREIRRALSNLFDFDWVNRTLYHGVYKRSEMFATCIIAVHDPEARTCEIVRAGHVPPVIVHPDSAVKPRIEDVPANRPLGLGFVSDPFESWTLDLPEGSLLVLCTDGLVESKNRDIGDGLQLLLDNLGDPEAGLEEICDTLTRTLVLEGDRDDLALLVARIGRAPSRSASWELPAETYAVREARHFVRQQVGSWGLPEDTIETAELLVSELATNAVRHAAGPGPIEIRLSYDERLTCEVADQVGAEPRPAALPDDLDESGRGLFLVSELSADWGSRRTSTGKVVWFALEALAVVAAA